MVICQRRDKVWNPSEEDTRRKRQALSVGGEPSDQSPFKIVPPNNKLLNDDDAPRAPKVGENEQGGFESAPPSNSLAAKRQKVAVKDENLKRGGTKGAKETPAYIPPLKVETMESSDLAKPSFVSAEGLADDNEDKAQDESVASQAEKRSLSRSVPPLPVDDPYIAPPQPNMDSAKIEVPAQDSAEFTKLTAQVQAYFDTLGVATERKVIKRTVQNVMACLSQLEMLGDFPITKEYRSQLGKLITGAESKIRRQKTKRPIDTVHDVQQHAKIAMAAKKRTKKQKILVRPPPPPEAIRTALQSPREQTTLRRLGPPNLDSAPGGDV